MSYDAIVLAGGAARRLGGADKPGLRVGGRALVARVVDACRSAGTVVVVGPHRPELDARVAWAREEPPGGGPVAALAAGLARVTADTVVVLSGDLPFLGAGTVQALIDETGDADGAMAVGADGRDQPLVAAYRTAALRAGLRRLTDEHGGPAGLPLRLLTKGLRLARIPAGASAFDCDTWEDLAVARARIRESGTVLDEWLTAVKNELGIELDVDTQVLLDLARDAAHAVARPAAPLTTFLAGYAAAQAGGGPEAVAEAARTCVALAARWEEENKEEGGAG
ncbi:Molybdenum cofactor guanylyltransferase [Streptomyces sp. RB5]|uniref:Molybdenum cofactor guanylyltransferase n=1 Tax=Streptomyces smaragdinus TaxID=2585196 RepID=A0A7K0CJ06_9ACTN|nr:NTP transferase domain-containing protein [Streptomyces smaragdinus]MQY12734.1 Molybdenum cofactor guanylyltransferase [Streptomyces smaragdinus]